MARYSYAGTFKNPTEGMTVETNADGLFYVAVEDRCECGHECCSRPVIGSHPHSNGMTWEDGDVAYEWLESLHEIFEADYDNYLEENHDAIVTMERYEMWRNEY